MGRFCTYMQSVHCPPQTILSHKTPTLLLSLSSPTELHVSTCTKFHANVIKCVTANDCPLYVKSPLPAPCSPKAFTDNLSLYVQVHVGHPGHRVGMQRCQGLRKFRSEIVLDLFRPRKDRLGKTLIMHMSDLAGTPAPPTCTTRGNNSWIGE